MTLQSKVMARNRFLEIPPCISPWALKINLELVLGSPDHPESALQSSSWRLDGDFLFLKIENVNDVSSCLFVVFPIQTQAMYIKVETKIHQNFAGSLSPTQQCHNGNSASMQLKETHKNNVTHAKQLSTTHATEANRATQSNACKTTQLMQLFHYFQMSEPTHLARHPYLFVALFCPLLVQCIFLLFTKFFSDQYRHSTTGVIISAKTRHLVTK